MDLIYFGIRLAYNITKCVKSDFFLDALYVAD